MYVVLAIPICFCILLKIDPIYERRGIMKKAWILIFSLFILSSVNCATKQEVSKAKPLNLSGTWILTEDMRGCGGTTTTSTVEIIQKGDAVTIVDSKNNKMFGKIYSDSILIAGITTLSSVGMVPGQIETPDHNLKISEDANTLTGKVKFTLKTSSGNCDGIAVFTYKRKSKK
jgi:hypothetical protein